MKMYFSIISGQTLLYPDKKEKEKKKKKKKHKVGIFSNFPSYIKYFSYFINVQFFIPIIPSLCQEIRLILLKSESLISLEIGEV